MQNQVKCFSIQHNQVDDQAADMYMYPGTQVGRSLHDVYTMYMMYCKLVVKIYEYARVQEIEG